MGGLYPILGTRQGGGWSVADIAAAAPFDPGSLSRSLQAAVSTAGPCLQPPPAAAAEAARRGPETDRREYSAKKENKDLSSM